MISVVIPVYNEEKNVSELHRELLGVLKNMHQEFEIIFVDDGSKDGTFTELKKLKSVKVISFLRNFGKSQALMAGFEEAGGERIITLDGDLQDDPKEIPRFLESMNAGADLVCGWKVNRLDDPSKIFLSKIANGVTRFFTGVEIHDMNCGFKGYTKEFAKNLKLHGDLHRYIPALAAYDGFRVAETPVNHRRRLHGNSKYGFFRVFSGFFDFLTVMFLRKYIDRPLHFFGPLGLTSFFAGFVILFYLTWVKLAYHIAIGSRPLLSLGVLLVFVGIQFFSLGLIGDLVVRKNGNERRNYIIRERVSNL
ncbi:MAG: hypothetical protein A3A28_04970 [Candidatus Sungbacteria bacterium RIFCSPLOWO2_01_FULL_47_32]|nr:MAG: Undecaprenyl-phosphate 4-deoxy-4-formamido-L-arabinose transferase [Parcubacteria group bacterium GW2011_GWA2_47_10]OHA04827.1 MAG: hypothetical protein A3A28_04970 [Candidatus Sungbacteria bacterium RIFCSPLOWO2_01_FULL_47_32]